MNDVFSKLPLVTVAEVKQIDHDIRRLKRERVDMIVWAFICLGIAAVTLIFVSSDFDRIAIPATLAVTGVIFIVFAVSRHRRAHKLWERRERLVHKALESKVR